jgi:hypothetical protein
LQRVGGAHIFCARRGADAQHVHRAGQQPWASVEHLQQMRPGRQRR